MKKVVLFFLIAILSLSGYEAAHGQMRMSINLNENWIVSESLTGFKSENTIPEDFQNPGEDWFKANMPKQIQDILFEKEIIPDPHVCLINKNKEVDNKEFSVGIREVQLVQKDEVTGEARFGFKINGQMIFMRGACWAPLEGMTHVWDNKRAAKLLDIFQAGNMNFIRVLNN
jgi:hypothetical protein